MPNLTITQIQKERPNIENKKDELLLTYISRFFGFFTKVNPIFIESTRVSFTVFTVFTSKKKF